MQKRKEDDNSQGGFAHKLKNPVLNLIIAETKVSGKYSPVQTFVGVMIRRR